MLAEQNDASADKILKKPRKELPTLFPHCKVAPGIKPQKILGTLRLKLLAAENRTAS